MFSRLSLSFLSRVDSERKIGQNDSFFNEGLRRKDPVFTKGCHTTIYEVEQTEKDSGTIFTEKRVFGVDNGI
jgi:hypothetical protein